MLEEKVIQVKVIGKTTERKGIFFRKTEYIVALEAVDIIMKPQTIERKVPFHQYASYGIGKTFSIRIYSRDKRVWYLSQEEADMFG